MPGQTAQRSSVHETGGTPEFVACLDFLLGGAEEMRVGAHRDDGGGVAELVGDVDGVAALGDEHAGVGVAQRVWGDVVQAGVLAETGEGAGGVAGADRRSGDGGEDRVAGSAVGAGEAVLA